MDAKYGTAYHSASIMARAKAHEENYITHEVYAPGIDLITIPSAADLEFVDLTVDAQVAEVAAIVVVDNDEAVEDEFDNGEAKVDFGGIDYICKTDVPKGFAKFLENPLIRCGS